MRRSSKRPGDFLKDLPPVLKFKFDDHPMFAREYERVRAGRPPVPLDVARYKLETPAPNKKNDETSWKQTLQKTQCLLRHQVLRMQQLAQEQNEKMEKVNRERKFHQQKAASELHVLSTQWKELCQKNIEIRVVSSQIEDQIQDRRREAEKKYMISPAQ